jgi:DNA-binding transcriptional LysR family regulator
MDQQMRYFIAVVDEHSFTRAAVKCNISQSAISQQVKELENTLGVKLLERKGRSFSVTSAGQYFYHHSKAIIGDLDNLIVKTQQIVKDQHEEYVLRLGYLVNFGTQEFLQAVSRFSKEFPQVRVRIKSGIHEELFELLRNDKIDLNFSDQRRALSNEYQNEFLTAANFMAVIPQGRFNGRKRVTTAELADLPCILIVGKEEKTQEERYCQDVLGVKSQFLSASTFDEGQMMVAAGQGFLIINSRAEKRVDTSINQVIPLYNGKNPLQQKYYAYWKRDNSGYYIETFAEILKKQFE